MVCTDTSFLLSLVGNDSNSRAAVAYVQTLVEPLRITALNRLEFENALRLLQFRGVLKEAEAATTVAAMDGDERMGRIMELACDWPAVMSEALRLSRARAEREGHRVLDILHVAAALKSAATVFLSFDGKQRRLAEKEGLTVGP